jgi:hypothetical protein
MSRQRTHRPSVRGGRHGAAPDDLHAPALDLYDYGLPPPPVRADRRGPQTENELADWIVTDDWPKHIPVSEAEVDLFERWFGDVFDELFGTKQ